MPSLTNLTLSRRKLLFISKFLWSTASSKQRKKIISDQRSNRELKCWLITHSTHYQKLLLYANKHFMYLNLAKSNHRRQRGAEGGKNHKASISIKLLEQPEWINPSMDWLWAPMGYTSASLRSGALSFVSAVYSPQSSTHSGLVSLQSHMMLTVPFEWMSDWLLA